MALHLMRFLRLLLLSVLLPSAGAFAFEPFFHAYGRAGDFREGGGAQAWIPLYQGCDWVTFGEIRLLRLREQWNGSGGGGIRKMFFGSIGVGANAFFDYSRADGAGGFWQGCGGVEIFGPCWDVTANYYYPDRQRKLADFRTEFVTFIDGTQILADEFLVFDRVRAYRGYDVNVGLIAPLCWGRLKGRGGYFRYTAPNSQVVEGPRMRLYWEVDSPFCPWTGTRWSIGGEWQYDNVRKEQAAIIVTLRFNLCAGPGVERCNPCYSGICRRMNDPVDRELGITIIRDEERELIDTRFVANIFFVEQNGMGTGSQIDPTNLLVAETNSVAGDFIFLLNNMGDIDVSILPDDTFNMKANQTMVSFDDSTSVTLSLGMFGTLTVDDLTGAGRGILAGATMPSVTLATNNLIDGIGIRGGPVGISGTGISGTMIDKTDIVGTTTAGIQLMTSSATTITDSGFGVLNTVVGASNAIDLDLTGNTGAFAVSGSRFENSTGTESIVINAGSAAYTFTDNTINKTTGRAIEIGTTTGVGGSVTFTGGTITNTMGTGIIVDASSAAVSIANATITGATTNSVTLMSNSGSFTLDNAMISSSSFPGVNGSTVTDVTIQNSTLMDLTVAGNGAIRLIDAGGTTAITNNTISDIIGALNSAVLIANTNLSSTINVTGNMISGSSNTVNGIAVAATGTGTTAVNVTSTNVLQGLTGDGIDINKLGTSGTLTATVMNNTLRNFGLGAPIRLASSSEGSTFTYTVQGNTIDTAAGIGMEIVPTSSGVALQTFQGRAITNSFTSVTGNAILLSPTLIAGDTLRTTFETNTFSSNSAGAINIVAGAAASAGTLSATLTGNADTSGTTGTAAYRAEATAAFIGMLCVDFTSNNSNNTAGIAVAGAAPATITVAPSNDPTDLSNANNGIGTTVVAGTLPDAAGPLPP